MIPKKIHYCWFGGGEIPEKDKQYIETWRKKCPDYEIIEWNESNYDITKNEYMYDAYKEKKWGFVPDYARFDIIYTHGGFYLDTDVELVRSLDSLRRYQAVMGFESGLWINGGIGFGAEPGHPAMKELRDMYDRISFYKKDKSLNLIPSPHYITYYFVRHGLIRNNKKQVVKNVNVFPMEYLSPKDYETGKIKTTPNTISIHHYAASWHSFDQRLIQTIRKRLVRIFGKKAGFKISRVVDFPIRVCAKVHNEGLKNTVRLSKNKIRNFFQKDKKQ